MATSPQSSRTTGRSSAVIRTHQKLGVKHRIFEGGFCGWSKMSFVVTMCFYGYLADHYRIIKNLQIKYDKNKNCTCIFGKFKISVEL